MSSNCQTTKFIVFWKIENFALNCCSPGQSIKTPFLIIDGVEKTSWQLAVYPRGDSPSMDTNSIAFSLDRRCGINELKELFMDFRVGILAEGGELCFLQTYENEDFSALHSGLILRDFIKRDLLQPKHLKNGTLTVMCKISISDVTFGPLYQNHNASLASLSDDITSMYENQLFPDLTLDSGGSSFKVHKFLMSARWLYYLRVFGEEALNASFTETTLDVNSTSSLSSFLRYLYSGKLRASEANLEFYNFLEQLRTYQVQRLMETLPTTIWLRTRMYKEAKILTWNQRDVHLLAEFPIIRLIPLVVVDEADLIVQFSVVEDHDGEWLGISFSFTDFPSNNVFCQCKAYLLLNNVKLRVLEVGHLFESDEEWHFPPFISKKELSAGKSRGASASVVCELTLCSDTENAVYESSHTGFETGSRGLTETGLLGSDLGFAYKSGIDNLYDVELSVQNNIFHAHKALLSARSKFFKQLFLQNPESGGVPLYISSSNWEILIEYMYSGTVNKRIERETVEDMSTVTNVCSFPLLKRFLELMSLKLN